MPGESVSAAYTGIGIVAAVVFFFIGLVFATDAWFAERGYGSLGRWVMEWSRVYPLWVFFFSFFLGALLGHLFTKPPLFGFHIG